MPVHVYLAGVEVFAPDARERAERTRELCRRYGLEPISPLDKGDVTEKSGAGAGSTALADAIYAKNIALIERADVIVADLNHFRGPEPDSGTSFEVGYAVGRGKPSYVHSADGDTAVDRVRAFHGPVTATPTGYVDAEGMSVEDFGAPFNLMLSSSSTVVRGDLEACLARVAADVEAGVLAGTTSSLR
ncbi:nucleoside 2-deoxyribosyltransferase [Rathayibacter sp. SD072]|nr:nucleoside 2-deoxyribosyltransferase [Rathayibacter sp. SD072]